MIDKPVYRRLLKTVGKAEGSLAASLLLKELATIFEDFAIELEQLYDDHPEDDKISLGYVFAADWCQAWAEEIDNE
jgi:hypothetical protein